MQLNIKPLTQNDKIEFGPVFFLNEKLCYFSELLTFSFKRIDMKTLSTILFIFCCMTQNLNAQRTVDDILLNNRSNVPRYSTEAKFYDRMLIPMGFGDSKVLEEYDKEVLKAARVKEVHVVYTDYPKDADLDALNKSRIKVIESIRKDLITDTLVKWKVIRQTACKDEEEARKLFHGISIIYINTIFVAEKEQLNNLIPSAITKKEAVQKINKLSDTTVYNVLNEMNWKGMTVITDFTSSMYPYSSQLVLWFAINTDQSKISDVFFFNAGDRKPDSLKINGSVGGIYHEHNVNYKDIRKLATETASKGIGGEDMEENDIEAVLKAIQKTPNAKGFVLIADNNAPPRDMALLKRVNKPVHVILCGVKDEIEISYLQLAYVTKGSLHTMEESLTELSRLHEGDTFKFNKKRYKLTRGNLTEVK